MSFSGRSARRRPVGRGPRAVSSARALVAILAALAAGTASCRLVGGTIEMPGKVASAAMGGGDEKKQPKADPEIVESRLRRYADAFAVEIGNTTEDFAARVGTPAGRIQALTWRLEYTGRMWRIAAAPRPYGSLFDAIVMVTAIRKTHEDHWRATWGEADEPVLASIVRLETEAWSVAAECLSEEQLKHMQAVVGDWLAENEGSQAVSMASLPGFEDLKPKGDEKNGLFADLRDLVSLDPLSGLEPAVREMAEARQLLERALYSAQHLPELLDTRLELMALRANQTQTVQETRASIERFSEAAASIAATARDLPERFAVERDATLKQISSELDAQRAGLVKDLETSREPLVELLEKSRATIEATRALSDALTVTVAAADEFMTRFDPKEAEQGTPLPRDETSSPPGRPFDITEYGEAAERIGVAVRELGTTITTLDRSLPELQRALDEAAARGDESVDHAFDRAYAFLAAALVGLLAVILLARWLAPRIRATSVSSQTARMP